MARSLPPRLVLGSVLVLGLTACGESFEMGVATHSVIYGEDDRREYFEQTEPVLRTIAAETAVAIMPTQTIDDRDPRGVRIDAKTFGERANLCPDEPFFAQPAPGRCSGVLIADDLVLTAGHCVTDLEDCRAVSFVFGFLYEGPNQLRPLDSDDIFECRRIVARGDPFESAGPGPNAAPLDYAIIQLDRPTGRTPAQFPASTTASQHAASTAGQTPSSTASTRTSALERFVLAPGQPIAVVSFPGGIPVKIDRGGRILPSERDEPTAFWASVDAFRGSSGAGVFDGEILVAMLVRGQPDFRPAGDCVRADKLAADHAPAEEALYLWAIFDAVCASRTGPSEALDPWCIDAFEEEGCRCYRTVQAAPIFSVLVIIVWLILMGRASVRFRLEFRQDSRSVRPSCS